MNNFLKILSLAMACLLLAGCGESNKEKALSQARNEGGGIKQNMPDCARRDPVTRRYLNEKGCTDAEYKAWLNQQGL